MNQSYIRVLQAIAFFCSEHLQINKFASDFPAQLPNLSTIDDAYPVLFVSPSTTIFDENATTFSIDVYCFDIIQKDRSNINTILSDTNLILNDLKKWLQDGDIFGMENVDVAVATPINNALLDYAAGWVMNITINAATYTVCEIPFNNIPIISGITNEIRYERFLTCESLEDCSTIQEIFSEISDRTLWKGNWVQQLYHKNEQVLDDSYLAIANKDTEDRPSPQPIGEPHFVYSGEIGSTSVNAKQVIFGNRYTLHEPFFIEGWRINTVAGNDYTVYLVQDPLGLPIINQFIHFTAQLSGWRNFNTSKTVLTSGSTYDLIVAVHEPDPTPTSFNGNWNYLKPTNPSNPNSGQMTHANKALGILNISKTDNNSNDRSAELATLNIGDIITIDTTRWAIQSSTDSGTFFTFSISPAIQLSSTGVKNFTFETVSNTPITYAFDPNFWSLNPPVNVSAQGLLGIDVNYNGLTADTTAYGIDLMIREIIQSPDWDIQAFSNVVSSTGSGGGSVTINGVEQDLSTNREWLTAQASTGVLNFGTGLAQSDLTHISISSMDGYVVDNESNPTIPTHIYVSYSANPNVLVTTLGSGTASYVLLDSTGTIFFQNTFPSSADRKQNIWLGKIAHPEGLITAVINEPDFITSPLSQLRDLFQALTYINKNVLAYPNGTNLSFNTSSGRILGDGINLHNSNLVPNELNVLPETPASFLYRTQSGGTNPLTSFISADTYDLNGILTSVPASASTVQWIFLVPDAGYVVQFGQTLYGSLADAVTAIGKEQFVVFPNLVDNSILIGVLAVTSTATDLSDVNQARFFRADMFGQIVGSQGGTSTTTLQGAYDNSTQAQITISSVLGALQVKGIGDGSDAIFQGLDSVNSVNLNISSDGSLTAKTITATTYFNLPHWTSGSSGNFSIKAKNDSSIDATGNYAVAEGFDTLASGDNSHAEGTGTQALGSSSHAEGWHTIASTFSGAHAEGEETFAGKAGAHAEGGGTQALGEYSHAEGLTTIAEGFYSHAEGQDTHTYPFANNSHAEGQQTQAIGLNSHAEGFRSQAIGDNSHAEGQDTQTTGENSHAGGNGCSVQSIGGFAHGLSNTIQSGGDYSVSFGSNNTVYGTNGIAVGNNNQLYVNSLNSGVFGDTNYIDADGCFMAGFNNQIVDGSNYSTIFGSTNIINQNAQWGFIAGTNNVISQDTVNINIFGSNIQASVSNNTYVEGLNIRDLGLGTAVAGLGVDGSGFVVATDSSTLLWEAGAGLYSIKQANPDFPNSTDGNYSVVMGSNNSIGSSGEDSIIGGLDSTILGSWSISVGRNLHSEGNYNAIFGADNSALGDCGATVIFGSGNNIQSRTCLVSGENNIIGTDAHNSAILGANNQIGGFSLGCFIFGSVSSIDGGLTDTIVLGNNINGTQSNTTYVDNLNIKTIPVGVSAGLLAHDINNNVIDGGIGTFNYLSKWTADFGLTDSQIFDDGSFVGINTSTPFEMLTVGGNVFADSFIKNGGTSVEFLMADGSTSFGVSSSFTGGTVPADTIFLAGITANTITKNGGTQAQYLKADGSVNELKTVGGVSLEGTGDVPVQIVLSSTTSLLATTLDVSGNTQHGKNVIIANGLSAITYTIDAPITTSFMKFGTGNITFLSGSGRTMIQVDGTNVLNGIIGSTASIISVGTQDFLRISNA